LLAARQPLYEQAELKIDTSPLSAAQAASALLRSLRRARFLDALNQQRPSACSLPFQLR
jgi:hypothetical protein